MISRLNTALRRAGIYFSLRKTHLQTLKRFLLKLIATVTAAAVVSYMLDEK